MRDDEIEVSCSIDSVYTATTFRHQSSSNMPPRNVPFSIVRSDAALGEAESIHAQMHPT